MIKRDKT
jgi:hypothetical protein